MNDFLANNINGARAKTREALALAQHCSFGALGKKIVACVNEADRLLDLAQRRIEEAKTTTPAE